jgi:hypothetical protein
MDLRLSQEQVRAFALSLPESHQHSHMGRPDLRVRNKIFATLPEDGLTVNVKTTPVALDMLLREDPSAFRDVWGGRWVGVELARVPAEEVRELLLEGYCLAAPRQLAALARGAREVPGGTTGEEPKPEEV